MYVIINNEKNINMNKYSVLSLGITIMLLMGLVVNSEAQCKVDANVTINHAKNSNNNDGSMIIQITQGSEPFELSLFKDFKKISSFEFNYDSRNKKFIISNLTPGLYYVFIKGNDALCNDPDEAYFSSTPRQIRVLDSKK